MATALLTPAESGKRLLEKIGFQVLEPAVNLPLTAARQEPHRVFAPRPSASVRLSIAVLKGRVVFLRPTNAARLLETPVGTAEARAEFHGPLAEVAYSACLNFQCMLRSGLHIDHSPRELRAGMLHRDPRLVFRSDGPTRVGLVDARTREVDRIVSTS